MFYSSKDKKYNKGYCHVFFNDKSTFDLILKQNSHYIGQRLIFCKAYVSG